jgi:hypothetical protein
MWIGIGEQLGSDMCHPCIGDTWHIHTTTHGRVRSADRTVDVEYKWTIGRLTCGFVLSKWSDATWSKHGLPHGTLLLVRGFGKFWSPSDSDRRSLHWASELASRASQPTYALYLIPYQRRLYLSLVCLKYEQR